MNKVIIYVEGGVVQGVRATSPQDIEVVLFDVDNLKAEGKSREQIDKMDREFARETKQVIC